MAFCNSCGTPTVPGAKFCSKCGAPAATGSPQAPAVSAAPASPVASSTAQSSGALKIVLIVVGVLVLLFVLGTSAALFVGWRIARQVRVDNNGDNVRVTTPFGSVESTNNADDIARELGMEIYPGSTVQKGNASSTNIAGIHTVAAQFESGDPPNKVAEFYKRKFPMANVSVASDDQYTIVSTSNQNLITINIEPDGGKTRIHIASVSGRHVSGGISSN
jgi:eukaryotic-like serine/threonine-protein kinase